MVTPQKKASADEPGWKATREAKMAAFAASNSERMLNGS
jgi:hypothetical protein